jgi:ABC-type antimicrobial peptide transport system permease subunit
MLHAVRVQVSSADPTQQVAGETTSPATLEELITMQSQWQQGHLVTMLLGAFALLALALAIVGLYSVVSYSVAQRTNEFGIRMTLGAQRSELMRIVFAFAGFSVTIGLAAGVLLSSAFNKLLAAWTPASSGDPLILWGVTLLLVCASTMASFFPARRASSIDPMEALRHE